MHPRGTLAALALASLFALPTAASAAIVQKWQSLPGNYGVVSLINDFDANNALEMLTVESGGRIGIRSCSSGALLTQSAATYDPRTFWFTYLEDSNQVEDIIFSDATTGNLVCMNYSAGALSVRWSFMPTSSGVPSNWTFVSFDGHTLSMVFKDTGVNQAKYYVRDNNGALVTTIDLTTSAPGAWSVSLIPDDFESNGRQGLMIDYHSVTQDVLYLYESNAPEPPATTGAAESHAFPHAHLEPRKFEPVNGVWTEAGRPERDLRDALRAVRLP